jgi:hypothetical protein
LPT